MLVHGVYVIHHADDVHITVSMTFREMDEIDYALLNTYGEDSVEFKTWKSIRMSIPLTPLPDAPPERER